MVETQRHSVWPTVQRTANVPVVQHINPVFQIPFTPGKYDGRDDAEVWLENVETLASIYKWKTLFAAQNLVFLGS